MLVNVSKGTTLYLTPVLMLTSLFLILFAYLAPAVMLHSQVSLLTVTPYSAVAQPGQAVDGPSMLEGMLGNLSEKPMFQEISAWMGISSFVLGLGSFLVVRMYFGKAAADFNLSIQGQGTSGPQLIAGTSNGFTMVWIGYAFFAIPVVVSLAKLHVLATKKPTGTPNFIIVYTLSYQVSILPCKT
ncbi:hypothetical protein BU15DRAFT_73479 [Melanogaster broomeanus]|nr:hypothetical protein BU15DRAFT_73479 [Melanogaster broomeanus]